MRKPTIHLNGTSKNDLAQGYCLANEAVRSAMNKLAESAPNARDYYPQGPGAWEKARDEHDARMEALRKVRSELYDLYLHCLET